MRHLVSTATAPEVHYHAVPPPLSVHYGAIVSSASASTSLSPTALVPPIPGSVNPPVVFEEEEASQCSAFDDVDPFDHLQAFVLKVGPFLDDQNTKAQPEEPTIPLNRSDIVQALIMAVKE